MTNVTAAAAAILIKLCDFTSILPSCVDWPEGLSSRDSPVGIWWIFQVVGGPIGGSVCLRYESVKQERGRAGWRFGCDWQAAF